jgi:hypothetical protein
VSKRTKNAQFEGSESELVSMTKEMDELHKDVAVPSMWAGDSNMIDGTRGATARPSSRRTFLVGAGAAAAGGAALMVVGSTPGLAGAATRAESRLHVADAAFPPAGYKGDLAVAAVAASLENLAGFDYKSGLAAATAGKLGTVPPAIGTFATTALSHHTQHAAAWNAVLKQNGKAKITVTNPSLTPTIQDWLSWP